MAWTTPRTWVAGELVTAVMMNTHVRDNLNALRDYLLGAQDLGANWQIMGARFLYFQASGVAHGMTSIVPTDVYARLGALSSTDGGLNINGFSDTDAVGVNISGVTGATSPTIVPFSLNSYKKSGTSVTNLAATEKAFRFTNGGTIMTNVYGNGMFEWIDAAVASGITSFFPTDCYGQILINSATDGGLRIRGITDADNQALYFGAFTGQTSSPTTAPLIVFDAYIRSGTGVAAGAAGQPILHVRNGGTDVFKLDGQGTQQLIGGGNTMTLDGPNSTIIFASAGSDDAIICTAGTTWTFTTNGATVFSVTSSQTNISSNLLPTSDNSKSCGGVGARWTAVYAANGTIQTSDAREKDAIRAVPYGLAHVLALRPVAFEWKKDQEKSLGFIAQEVWPLIPEACRPPATDDELWGMHYDRLVPVLVRAIQELSDKVQRLEAA